MSYGNETCQNEESSSRVQQNHQTDAVFVVESKPDDLQLNHQGENAPDDGMDMASRKARINIEGEHEPQELAKKAKKVKGTKKGTGMLPVINR